MTIVVIMLHHPKYLSHCQMHRAILTLVTPSSNQSLSSTISRSFAGVARIRLGTHSVDVACRIAVASLQ